MKKKQKYMVSIDSQSELIISIAQYVEEENWDVVFKSLLELVQQSFQDGFTKGFEITTPIKKRLKNN